MSNSFNRRSVAFRHWLIRSRWRDWIVPLICIVPYCFSIIWMLNRGLIWIAQLMLAPILMGSLLAGITLELARREFSQHRRR